jgi:hypothetical protein
MRQRQVLETERILDWHGRLWKQFARVNDAEPHKLLECAAADRPIVLTGDLADALNVVRELLGLGFIDGA